MDVNVRAAGLRVKWKCHSDKERTFRAQERVLVFVRACVEEDLVAYFGGAL